MSGLSGGRGPALRRAPSDPTPQTRANNARYRDGEERNSRSGATWGGAAAEPVEGRRPTKGNALPSAAPRTQSRATASTGSQRVREVARRDRRARFTCLLHHVTVDLLRASFYGLQRQAAPGVDGVTWAQYEVELEDRLRNLHERVHRGAYRAQPSRRVYIPKADGSQRALGIAALEDKLVQQTVSTVLNAIYRERLLGLFVWLPRWTLSGWETCGRR